MILHLKSLGRKETSLLPLGRRLRFLARHVDLDNPPKVISFIASQPWSSNYKGNVVLAYMHYARFYKLVWQTPFYQREDKEFRVPTSEDVNKIISHAWLKGAMKSFIVGQVFRVCSSGLIFWGIWFVANNAQLLHLEEKEIARFRKTVLFFYENTVRISALQAKLDW